ncbi:hypothetical protein [Paraburkholderia aspalathi]|uniref:hypothetical protein n=1 Tax=Paraburkholderia aspalathi TaxID=1324617 RepID=UPI0038B71DD4
MTIEELNSIVADAKAGKVVSPQLNAADLAAAMRQSPAVLSEIKAKGAPVNLDGTTDLFAVFEWLLAQNHCVMNHYLGCADEVLRTQWSVSRKA